MLTGDEGIRAVNGAHLRHDEVTDVVSLSFDPIPGEPSPLIGEIVVNAMRAVRSAPRVRNGTPARELALYVAHGLDHLTGADDQTPRERNAMRRRELRWVRAAEKRGLLEGLYE